MRRAVLGEEERFSYPGCATILVIALVALLTLFAALCVGAFVGWQAAERKNQSDSAAKGVNHIEECEMDDDGDGRIDSWGVMMRQGQPVSARVWFHDHDGDGEPDSLFMHGGQPEAMFSRMPPAEDVDGDWIVTLANMANADEVYSYIDGDLDGWLDYVEYQVNRQPVAAWDMLDGAWVPVQEDSADEE